MQISANSQVQMQAYNKTQQLQPAAEQTASTKTLQSFITFSGRLSLLQKAKSCFSKKSGTRVSTITRLSANFLAFISKWSTNCRPCPVTALCGSIPKERISARPVSYIYSDAQPDTLPSISVTANSLIECTMSLLARGKFSPTVAQC